MVTEVKSRQTCPRCGSRLIGNGEEGFCINHGPPSPVPVDKPKPISQPEPSRRKTPLPATRQFHLPLKKEDTVKTVTKDVTPATENKSPALDQPEAKNQKPAADPGAAAAANTRSSKELTPPPVKPSGKNAIHQFYVDNKDRIIADYQKLGALPAAANWGMNNSTIYKLLNGWGVRKKEGKPAAGYAPERHKTPALPPPATPGNLVLPALPDFNPNWSMDVQQCWMEIYGKLIKKD